MERNTFKSITKGVMILLATCFLGSACLADVAADMQSASELVKAEKLNEATDVYKKIIADYPSSKEATQAYYEIGSCYSSLGKNSEAIASYNKAIELNPSIKCHAEFCIGWCYQSQQKYTEAIAAYKTVLASVPASTTKEDYDVKYSKINIAGCYKGSRDFDSAIAQYLALAEEYSQEAGNFKMDVAACYLEKQDYEKAISIYSEISRKYSNVAYNAKYQMGWCYQCLKKTDDAISAYKTALVSAPAEIAKDDDCIKNSRIHLAECYKDKAERTTAQVDWDNAVAQYLLITEEYPEMDFSNDLKYCSYYAGKTTVGISVAS